MSTEIPETPVFNDINCLQREYEHACRVTDMLYEQMLDLQEKIEHSKEMVEMAKLRVRYEIERVCQTEEWESEEQAEMIRAYLTNLHLSAQAAY